MKKTTLELPDALMHQVKLRAAHRQQKLKDVIAQLLELGMAVARDTDRAPVPPKPVRLKGRHRLTIEDIDEIVESGRD